MEEIWKWKKSPILTIFSTFDPFKASKNTKNPLELVKNNVFHPYKPFKTDLERITSKKISAIFDLFSTLDPIIARSSGQKQPNGTKPGLKRPQDIGLRANTK